MKRAEASLIFPEGEFKAYLFDCDGTIADTMPLHYIAWNEALAPFKITFPTDLFYQYAGMRASKIIELLNEQFGLSMNADAVNHVKEKYYLAHLSEVQPVTSVVDIILKSKIPMAVVSGSPRASVMRTLETLKLRNRFVDHTIVGAEDYLHAKPHPEPFLTAAKRLGIAPEYCLVFEDADLGIQSAEAAGMAWVKV